MSYLVLARKWRPQVFEDLVGQDHVTRTLQNAIQSGRVAHAFLFSGARGVGKTSAARILAKCLNCEQGATPVPCNACGPCTEITEGRSVDIFEIDGASNTGVDDVRALRENVKYLPSSARQKVYIIDEVHMLSKSAFNALLKTLEEPPPHITFIFATTEPHQIPATILSRCQRYDFKRIPLGKIMDRLKAIAEAEGITLANDGAMILGRAADGSMRDAQSLFDQVISYAGETIEAEAVRQILGVMDRRSIMNVTRAILEQQPERCLRLVEEIHEAGYDLKQFARELLAFLRDLVVIKVAPETEGLVDLPEGELAEAREMVDPSPAEDVQNLFTVFCKIEEEVLHSQHPRLNIEMGLVKLARMTPLAPVKELIERLMALEGAQSGAGTSYRADDAVTRSVGGRAGWAPGPPAPPPPDQAQRHRGTEAQRVAPEGPAPVAPPQEQRGRGAEGQRADAPPVLVEPEPEPEPPSSGGAHGDERAVWQKILARVRIEKPSLAPSLEKAESVSIGDHEVRIGYNESDTFIVAMLQEKGWSHFLRKLCRDLLGPKLRVSVALIEKGPTASPKKPANPAGKNVAPERNIRREAMESPIVQEAIEIFNGELVEVRAKRKS